MPLNHIFQSKRSPIAILADCVAKVVDHRWLTIERSSFKKDLALSSSALHTAYEFVELSRKKASENAYKDHYEKVSAAHKAMLKSYEYKEENSISNQIFEALFFLFLFILGGSALVLLPSLTVKAISENPEAVIGLLVVWLVAFVIFRIFDLKEPRWKFQEAFVYGSGYFTRRHFLGDAEVFQNKRDLLVRLMSRTPSINEISLGADPDITTLKGGGSVALPPGVSEIALIGIDDEAISEIRGHLKSVRLQHLLFSSFSFMGFLVVTGVTIYGIVFRGLQAEPQLLGGGGIATVLGLFCFSTLQNLRTSQIALALFSSYLSELKGKLIHASALSDNKEIADACGQAWKDFRQGINDLWVLEKKRRPLFKA